MIRELLQNWVVWRDAGDWERFKTVWHDDGYMMATWFQGPASEFIRVSREGWHRGVIGIVAQRVVERYHRPALVVGVEDGVGVGSGRSISGFHLLNALTQSGDLFARFGGHAQAAGFSIPSERIPELEARFEASARAALTPRDLAPVLRLDGELSLREVGLDLCDALRSLGPHGVGNPTPVFAARGVSIVAPPRIIKDKHLKLRVAQGPKSVTAIGWGLAEQGQALTVGQELDLAFTLGEDAYGEMATAQLVIKDLRPAKSGN